MIARQLMAAGLAAMILSPAYAWAQEALSPVFPRVTNPDWKLKPTRSDIERYYPARAAESEVAGRATISCSVSVKGRLVNCKVIDESPADYGFGDAAIRMAAIFEMTPKLIDDVAVEGGQVTIPIVFQPIVDYRPTVMEPPPTRMERFLDGVFRVLGFIALLVISGLSIWLRLENFNNGEKERRRDENALSRLLGRD